MMLAYNLFLLFKIDFLRTTEYRQQIKTFRLKYIFLAGKIIKTARSVVIKLSESIHIKRSMKKAYLDETTYSHGSARCYHLSQAGKIVLHIRIWKIDGYIMIENNENNA